MYDKKIEGRREEQTAKKDYGERRKDENQCSGGVQLQKHFR